jgi:type IV secretion system protein VirB5
MNGMRDTSSLLKNDLLKQAVPLDFQKFQDAVKASAQGGSGSGISGDINKYVSANQSVTCDKAYTSAAQQKTCKQNWSEIGGQQVVGQTGYDAAFKDLDNIGAMLNAIKATPDAKAIADMQARLQLQAVKQAGEAAKLNAYKLMTDANDRMKIQKASDDYSASAKRVLN